MGNYVTLKPHQVGKNLIVDTESHRRRRATAAWSRLATPGQYPRRPPPTPRPPARRKPPRPRTAPAARPRPPRPDPRPCPTDPAPPQRPPPEPPTSADCRIPSLPRFCPPFRITSPARRGEPATRRGSTAELRRHPRGLPLVRSPAPFSAPLPAARAPLLRRPAPLRTPPGHILEPTGGPAGQRPATCQLEGKAVRAGRCGPQRRQDREPGSVRCHNRARPEVPSAFLVDDVLVLDSLRERLLTDSFSGQKPRARVGSRRAPGSARTGAESASCGAHDRSLPHAMHPRSLPTGNRVATSTGKIMSRGVVRDGRGFVEFVVPDGDLQQRRDLEWSGRYQFRLCDGGVLCCSARLRTCCSARLRTCKWGRPGGRARGRWW